MRSVNGMYMKQLTLVEFRKPQEELPTDCVGVMGKVCSRGGLGGS